MKNYIYSLFFICLFISACGEDASTSSTPSEDSKAFLLSFCKASAEETFSLEYDSAAQKFEDCKPSQGASICQGFAYAELSRSLASCKAANSSGEAFDSFLKGKNLDDFR